MDAEITVLIPARNGAAFIADAIESVLGQSFERWRLLITDDASTDDTAAVASRYLSDPRIQLQKNPANLGLAGNWNKCFAAVRTKYFMLLCQDDFLYSPRALQIAFEILERNPDIPAVYCDLMMVDAGKQPLLKRSFHRSGLIDSAKLARISIRQTRNAFGVALLQRKESAGDIGYDPELCFAIDVDFSIAMAGGRPVYHVPEPLIGYRYHGKNATGVLLSRLVKEMVHIAGKHGIPLHVWDRAAMQVLACVTNFARQAVLWYGARRRSAAKSLS